MAYTPDKDSNAHKACSIFRRKPGLVLTTRELAAQIGCPTGSLTALVHTPYSHGAIAKGKGPDGYTVTWFAGAKLDQAVLGLPGDPDKPSPPAPVMRASSVPLPAPSRAAPTPAVKKPIPTALSNHDRRALEHAMLVKVVAEPPPANRTIGAYTIESGVPLVRVRAGPRKNKYHELLDAMLVGDSVVMERKEAKRVFQSAARYAKTAGQKYNLRHCSPDSSRLYRTA